MKRRNSGARSYSKANKQVTRLRSDPEVENVRNLIRQQRQQSSSPQILLQSIEARSDHAKIKKIERLEKLGDPQSHRFAGDLLIEMASYSTSFIDAANHIYRAQKNWEMSLDKSPGHTEQTIKSAIQLIHLPIYHDFILERKTPHPTTVNETYKKLVNLGETTARRLCQDEPIYNVKEFVGATAELNVLQLLYRFSDKHGQGEWSIMPSFATCDRGHKPSENEERSSWDISVFNQPDTVTAPQLLHKVQVKSRPRAITYCPDISVINVNPDLDLRTRQPGSGMPVSEIFAECYSELYSEHPTTAEIARFNLDKRTNILLDKLIELPL